MRLTGFEDPRSRSRHNSSNGVATLFLLRCCDCCDDRRNGTLSRSSAADVGGQLLEFGLSHREEFDLSII